eukprot:2800702-Amphidinium_carterae.1
MSRNGRRMVATLSRICRGSIADCQNVTPAAARDLVAEMPRIWNGIVPAVAGTCHGLDALPIRTNLLD